MEDIRKFVTERVRRNKAEDEPITGKAGQVPSDEYFSAGGKVLKMAQLKKEEGKKATANASRGTWAINEPENNDAFDESELSPEKLTKNKKALLGKFRAEEDFFIMGKAGWGKTALIKKMASTFKRSIVTVYLDKAMATDLGGIPIPTRSSKGNAKQEYAMPGWAAEMLENPDKEYLLFFDEMNQAAPDVMNALMPIVLEHEICGIKFDNFFVGAAGNFESENQAVNELSGPLASRFKPIIEWDVNSTQAWDDVFEHLHRVWDGVFGPEFIEKFHEKDELFENPREIEHKIFKFLQKLIASGQDNSVFDADYFNERLIQLAKKELTPTEKDKLATLAEDIYEYMMSGGTSLKPTKKSSKTAEMIPNDVQEILTCAIRDGYFMFGPPGGDKEKYGVSKESIFDIYDADVVNAEQINRLIKKLKADGVDFYYKTDAEVKKDGLTPIPR